MQRVTITIDEDLVAELERYMAARGYANRSEAIREPAMPHDHGRRNGHLQAHRVTPRK